MMNNIYYYDNSAPPYEKLGNRISEKLIKLNPDVRIFYIYDGYNQETVSLNQQLKENVEIVDSKKIPFLLKKFPADCFVCFGQPSRIPDAFWTLYFNRKSIPTVRVQHGLFIKEYIRTQSFFKDQKARTIYYGFYLVLIFLYSKFGCKISTCLELINKQVNLFKNSKKKVDNKIGSKHLIIWGEYWKEWFKSYPYYSDENNFYVCGGFDFELLEKKEKIIEPQNQSVVYICQTLIEDGRLEADLFKKFLEKLYDCAKSFEGNFYLKLHPRSDLSLYSDFEKLDNVIITHKFPIAEYYISHYSSLLSVSAYLQKKILLIKFPGHEIPEAFEHMSQNAIDYDEEIHIESIDSLNIPNTDYFYNYVTEPYEKIAGLILDKEIIN